MKKQELKSFNEVVRDISSLEDLNDASLDAVVGGKVVVIEKCNTDIIACEPNCRALNVA